WLMFLLVKNWLKFNPAKVLAPEKPVSPLTLPGRSPLAPLNAMSPPCNLTEKPEFMVIDTITVLAPTSVIVTPPMGPEMPRLLAVRVNDTELAEADGTTMSSTDRANNTRIGFLKGTGFLPKTSTLDCTCFSAWRGPFRKRESTGG